MGPSSISRVRAGADAVTGVAGRAFTRRRFLQLACALAPGAVGARLMWPTLPAKRGPRAPGATGGTAAPGVVAAAARTPSWAFACDTQACIGCGFCVEACKLENHVPLEPEYNRTWVERHVISSDGTIFVDSPEAGIHGFPPKSTAPGADEHSVESSRFVPRLCMQCENPPCVAVCPVSATFKTDEGVVLVDQDRCIGCGYCVVACPYGARYITPNRGQTPTNTPGVADKCTWCYPRITKGKQPACVEVCPVGARLFGDLADPASPLHAIVEKPGVQVLRPDLGTGPRVYYLGLEAEVG